MRKSAAEIHREKTLARLRAGGWPEVLDWTQRSLLATRAGVAMPDEYAMTLVRAAGVLATSKGLRVASDWEVYTEWTAHQRG